MAQMTNLLVKDDAATPKEFTFLPVTDNPNPSWRGADPLTPLAGQPRYSTTMEKVKNGDYKVTAKLEVPVMETLGASGTAAGYVAPPAVAYVVTAIFTMFVPARSTSADRMNAYRMAVGLLQGASVATGTGTLVNAAAGGVWSANAAPIPQLFNNLLLPN